MKQKRVSVKKLLEKYGDLPNEGGFEEFVSKTAQTKPKRRKKKRE